MRRPLLSNGQLHSSTETQLSLLHVGTCLPSRCLETLWANPLQFILDKWDKFYLVRDGFGVGIKTENTSSRISGKPSLLWVSDWSKRVGNSDRYFSELTTDYCHNSTKTLNKWYHWANILLISWRSAVVEEAKGRKERGVMWSVLKEFTWLLANKKPITRISFCLGKSMLTWA
jgi:hypothetical protein